MYWVVSNSLLWIIGSSLDELYELFLDFDELFFGSKDLIVPELLVF
jgi:hypothetical protein